MGILSGNKATVPAKVTTNAPPPKSGEVLPPEGETESAKATSTVTDIAEVKSGGLPAEFVSELDTGATGLDQVTAKDIIIPRITILQKLSPQLEPRKSEFIKDAQAGDFCDVALGDLFKELVLLPCYFATVYLEWGAKRGDGLIHNHGLDASVLKKCKRDDQGKYITSKELGAERDGNFIAETATWFMINLTAGGRRSFLPLSSTNLKASRKLMTMITNQRISRGDGTEFQPPIFYRSFKVSMTHEANEKGDWFGWKFEPDQTIFEIDPAKNLLKEAKEFLEQARAGLVQGDLTSYAEDGTTPEGGGGMKTVSKEENAEKAM